MIIQLKWKWMVSILFTFCDKKRECVNVWDWVVKKEKDACKVCIYIFCMAPHLVACWGMITYAHTIGPVSQWGKLFLSELDPKLVFLLISFRLYARSNLPFQIDHADVQKLMQLKGIFIHVGQQPHQTRILIFSFFLSLYFHSSFFHTC